ILLSEVVVHILRLGGPSVGEGKLHSATYRPARGPLRIPIHRGERRKHTEPFILRSLSPNLSNRQTAFCIEQRPTPRMPQASCQQCQVMHLSIAGEEKVPYVRTAFATRRIGRTIIQFRTEHPTPALKVVAGLPTDEIASEIRLINSPQQRRKPAFATPGCSGKCSNIRA